MIIHNVDFYLDGGTVKFVTSEGEFYLDRRIGTETKNILYDKYPNEKDAKIVAMQEAFLNASIDDNEINARYATLIQAALDGMQVQSRLSVST